MQRQASYVGQQMRVHYPGSGDHGQVSTIKRQLDNRPYDDRDGDERSQHRGMFAAANLNRIPDAPLFRNGVLVIPDQAIGR